MTPITAWGRTFKSVEHGYTYYKALMMNRRAEGEEILKTRNAKSAKDIGDKIETNLKWQDIKNNVMFHLLQQKAKQCDLFNKHLYDSQNAILVEDTANEYWGRGRTGTGQNTLGRMLMTIRKNLPKAQTSISDQFSDDMTWTPAPQYDQQNAWFTPKPRRNPQKWVNGRNRPTSRDEQQNCFNCGEMSHTVTTCRHKYRLKCFLCNSEGHKKKFCPRSLYSDQWGQYD